ncbi:MAG: hypothetical protein K2X62_11350, partial [Beijerinckiaceae bacterium]|nr:hypothetical protein [Beijerinckiaceae bacterium]
MVEKLRDAANLLFGELALGRPASLRVQYAKSSAAALLMPRRSLCRGAWAPDQAGGMRAAFRETA